MSVVRNSEVSAVQGFLMSMGKHSGLLQPSIIVKVSAVKGCPLSGISL